MVIMKTTKYAVAFLTALFIGIVLIERLPGVMVPTSEPYESLMFGLFKISLLDDITHGISGLLGLAALIAGYRWRVYFLMLIGGYYALDATFFIVNGFMTGQSLVDNVLLNGPHIGITAVVIYALSQSLRKIELR
jgi:hypothetical protein